MSWEHVSLELRPKTNETVSSAYKWGKTVTNGGSAAWEPTSSNVRQVMHDRLQVSAWNGTDVAYLSCRPRARRRLDVVTCDQQTVDVTSRSSLQTDVYWQNSIFLCWSVCMEQSSCISVRRNAYPGLLAFTKLSFSVNVKLLCPIGIVLCSHKCFLFAI